MRFFPQLASGAVAQYPLERAWRYRTVRQEMRDGTVRRYDDGGPGELEWAIGLESLTPPEMGALQALFEQCRGRFGEFVMLDPAGNLVSWSEDLSKPVWVKDPLLTVTAGVADPGGTTRATRLINAGLGPQGVTQSLTVPGWYRYCWSGWFRSEGGGAGRLLLNAGGSQGEALVGAGSQWQRFHWTGQLASGAEEVSARFELEAGAAVEVFGLQLEAQGARSDYAMTGAQSGVYPHARFAEDELVETAESAGLSRSRIRVVSKVEG